MNREIRGWILDNWLAILNKRPDNWQDHIPEDAFKKMNEHFLGLPRVWAEINSPSVVQALLLKGAQVDYQEIMELKCKVTTGMTCFHMCMKYGRLDVAKIRKLALVDRL